MEAELEEVEVEDGVGDELAGAVVGDVPAAVGLVDLDAGCGERAGGGDQVLGGVGSRGDGDDGGVLDEEDDAVSRS